MSPAQVASVCTRAQTYLHFDFVAGGVSTRRGSFFEEELGGCSSILKHFWI